MAPTEMRYADGAAGDWLSGRALRSHRRGHWFEPSIAHNDRTPGQVSCEADLGFCAATGPRYWTVTGRLLDVARRRAVAVDPGAGGVEHALQGRGVLTGAHGVDRLL